MLGMSSLLFLLAYPHKKNKGRGQTWGNEFKKKKSYLAVKKIEDALWQSCVLKWCKFESRRESLQRILSASGEDRQMQVPV